MNVVEIDSEKLEKREGVSAKGTPYTVWKQTGYIVVYDPETNLPKKYPAEFSITHREDKPYPKGIYFLSPASVSVGNWGALDMFIELVTPDQFREMVMPVLTQYCKKAAA